MIKISNTNKSERITVYVSPNMKERINERAKACKMSVSDYMFACTVVTEINIIGDSDSFKKLVYEVNKIGANINQIRLLATLVKLISLILVSAMKHLMISKRKYIQQ